MDFELPEIKINSFKEADTAINKFKKLIKKKDITHDYIKNEFFNHFGAFFILCKYYESEFFDYIPIYRARPAKKIKNVEDIRQYGAPPIDELCGDGRANLDGRNVFYGSSNPLGALIETKQVYSGEEFYVGKWVFNKEKYGKTKIAITSYLNYNKKNKRDWEDILAITKEDKINELKKFYGNDKAHIIHYLIDKLSQFFLINSNSYYKLTGFLADQIIYSPSNPNLPNLLLYPSVINNSFLNLAIHPNFIQDYFILEKVIKIKIKSLKSRNSIEVIPIEFGLVNGNKMTFHLREIDLNERCFTIKSLNCLCGQKVEFENPEELILKNLIDKKENNLVQVAKQFLEPYLRKTDYNDVLKNLFEDNGLALAINQEIKLDLNNWSFKMADDLHKYLVAECEIIQPIKYVKR